MRQELLNYLSSVLTGDIKTSSELPWSSGDELLYLKNMKRLYIDRDNITQETALAVLPPAEDVMKTTNIVRAYLAIDAKNQPSNIDTVLTTIKEAKDINTIVGVVGRECDYETTFEGDVLIYTFTYRFITIH